MRTLVTLSVLAIAAASNAIVGVVPNAYAGTPGTGSFLFMVTTARTYQEVISANQLTGLIGSNLNGITFRLPNSATAAWPPTLAANFASFDIYVGAGVTPSSALNNLPLNFIGTPTLVRSGALSIAPGSFTLAGSPNAFGPVISFSNYLYTGGNLTIEIRHTGMTGNTTGGSFDALTSTTAGWGIDFGAHWTTNGTGSGTASPGNFLVTQLTATPVPEPATMAALSLGALALIRRRRNG